MSLFFIVYGWIPSGQTLYFALLCIYRENKSLLSLNINYCRRVQRFGISGPHWKKKSYLGHTLIHKH